MNSTINTPIVRYTPESQLQTPLKLLRSMARDLLASRELGWRLFVRDISSQYRQSLLGILWAFIPPILTGLIFIFLQSRNVVNLGETKIPYPVFVLVGTILWQLFTESLGAPLKSISAAKPMLAKINFPREALILSAFYSSVLSFAIKAVVLLAIFLYFKIEFTWGMLLAPLAILMLILLGLCLGLLITPIGVLYSDIMTSIPVITQLLFFVTPVVYVVPNYFPFSLIANVNPVSPILTAARDLLTTGQITNLIPFLVISGLSLIVLLLSWILYRVSLPIIIERMSA